MHFVTLVCLRVWLLCLCVCAYGGQYVGTLDLEVINADALSKYQALITKDKESGRMLWPDSVAVDKETHIVVELPRDEDGNYVYRTAHFEFHCDVKLPSALVQDMSLTFEATRKMVRSLPMNFYQPEPREGFYKIRLFREYKDFVKAGGAVGSGGAYMSDTRETLVPLLALSVRRGSGGWELSKDGLNLVQQKTLIHELTHQLTHYWIDFPVWFTEGLAEYVSEIPYKDGVFRPSEHRPDKALKRLGYPIHDVPIYSLEYMLRLSNRAWNAEFERRGGDAAGHYRSAYLYTYYFMHLQDRSGYAAPLRVWLQQTGYHGMPDFVSTINIEQWAAMTPMSQQRYLLERGQDRMSRVDYSFLLNGRRIGAIERDVYTRLIPEGVKVKIKR